MKQWHKIGLGLGGILLIAGIVQGNTILPSTQHLSSNASVRQEINNDAPELQTPPTPTVFDTTLSYGSSGTAVASLQVFLAHEGLYAGRDTGIFDQITENGVRAFEVQEHIKPVDGVFGSMERAHANIVISTHPEWLTTLSNSGSYSNVNGSQVHSPSYSTNGIPAGASAICRDGSYSFSMHRSGTCSHHGGVAEWL